MNERPSEIHLVPHTHWDREWYEPFQRFRLRLVDLMDDVTERAVREPGFRFTMDGQMAAVTDYLDVRPDRRDVVRRLVAGGQLAIGPWRVLLDEFLCSGENIIRNLQLGWAAASALGEPMAVGYLPDMFGHCAQMPQILRLAGLRHACVWRGVPAAVTGHAFSWVAPDGTAIRTEYLPFGYGNAADVFDGVERPGGESAAGRLAGRLAQQRAWFGSDPFLAMYGTDHAAPLPGLMQQVAAISATGTVVRVATLADYVLAADPDERGLPAVRGELRSHARANILPGVLSVRWHLKEAMARAERMVERYAEPLAALWSEQWPQAYLDLAWARLVDSACHDSVTGCGVDETALQVAARIAEGEQAGQAVRDRATARLAAGVARGAALVVNPSPAERVGLVELDVPVPDEWPAVALQLPDGTRVAAQEVGRNARVLADERVRAENVPDVFRRVHDRELFGQQITRIDVDESARELTFHVATDPGTEPFDAVTARERAVTATRRQPGEWRVRTIDEPRRRVVAGVPMPALGWTAVAPVPGGTGGTDRPVAYPVEVAGDGAPVIRNGLLSVSVRGDGTLRLESADGTVLDGVGRLVDGGDRGDSYNYAPPAGDRLVTEPDEVAIRVVERGPWRARLEVVRRYLWPAALGDDGRRSDRAEPVEVTMLVDVHAGEPFARLQLTWENRSRDHRLRLHVPLGRPATVSHAEGQFAVVARGMSPEAGLAGEHPIATYPASGFADAGGAGVLLSRTVEYELTDAGELAVTLLRAIGYLSRNVHPYRDEPAGPQLATPTAQCIGPAEVRLAVLPHAGSWQDARLVDAVESYRYPPVIRSGTGPADLPPRAVTGLPVSGDGVVLSALRRRGERYELRLVAETDAATVARVGSPEVRVGSARRLDLLGRVGDDLAPAQGVLDLPLRAWEIATVELTIDRRLTG